MSFTTVEILLFAFGLIPQYVSVFVVEKYYTNFWTGFWNLFGLVEVLIALVLSTESPKMVPYGAVILVGIMTFLYLTLLEGYQNIARRFGASLATTSLSWGLFVWFYRDDILLGAFIGLLHALLVIGLAFILDV